MARFPIRESDILALAQDLTAGFTAHADVFPSPPVNPQDFLAALVAYQSARDAHINAQAQASEALTSKQAALDHLSELMKSQLRYAENTAGGDEQLNLIGWSGRRAPTALERPGQCRLLEAPRRGEGWVYLDWKEPLEGGKPSAYEVQRRELPDGPWTHAATAVESEATLTDQPRGKSLEYRVLAVNKAGHGAESNVVAVLL
ncbi:MAG: fibronectin type III domain-containing protein [Methylococcaceae bacterium]|nr:fibronectin type III domain-containing protein [Methylococcaceae bacterium]